MTPIKSAVKRGALIAAANWQVTLIQTTADSLFKLLLAAPLVGGVFLVALAVGSDPQALIVLGWREMATTIVSSLLSQPVVLTAFLAAVGVVAIGGSFFVFLVKAGTVATLVHSERQTGPVEEPPLHVDNVIDAGRFSMDSFTAWARAFFPRYARLGAMLIAVYVASGVGYFALMANRVGGGSWSVTALMTAGFVIWITLVNLLYLLLQIVVTAEDCSVASAARRVAELLRREGRKVAAIFAIVLVLAVGATGASLLATAALGLVAFVPFVGLAALPLQLIALLLRGLVFQYLALTSVGAYLRVYRTAPVYDGLRQVSFADRTSSA